MAEVTGELRVSGLTAYYGNIAALHDVSLDVPPGGFVGLLGANGAGKSTTLRAITGLIRRSGDVVLDGTSIEARSTEAIVKSGVAMVPEGRGTFGQLTVAENLMAATYCRTGEIDEGLDFVYTCFPVLRERHRQTAASLSGGEQQMLAIGRALMSEPKVLLIDEMSLGLAPIAAAQILETIVQLNAESGLSVLLVEQNAELALKAVRMVYVLSLGRIVDSGDPASVREGDILRAAYLGE